jgi:hypothetical protein
MSCEACLLGWFQRFGGTCASFSISLFYLEEVAAGSSEIMVPVYRYKLIFKKISVLRFAYFYN